MVVIAFILFFFDVDCSKGHSGDQRSTCDKQ